MVDSFCWKHVRGVHIITRLAGSPYCVLHGILPVGGAYTIGGVERPENEATWVQVQHACI